MPPLRTRANIESKAIAALIDKLKLLDRKVARKALKDGVNDATKVVMWDAKSHVPTRTGQLRKSIGRKVFVKKSGSVILGFIGPRKGFRTVLNGEPIDPVKYAHLVEYGRREVIVKKKKVLATGGTPEKREIFFGKKVRSVPPRPFMRPAWAKNERRVSGLIIQRLVKAMRDFYAKGRAKLRK